MKGQGYKVTSAFPEPNYTQTPNDFFSMIPDMGEAELRVTLVMIRETFGFHRDGFKMGVTKLAKAAGLSRQGTLDGASAAQDRGTFRRTNPDAQGEAEWELIVETIQQDDPLQPVEGGIKPVEGTPQAGGGQVGVKERKKVIKESSVSLSKEEKQEVNKAVDYILQSSKNPNAWTGRETFADNSLPLVDWYHKVTGQDCPKSKRADWMKAVTAWQKGRLTVEDLQAAYTADIGWRKAFTSPNQLTEKATALKAQKSVIQIQPANTADQSWRQEVTL